MKTRKGVDPDGREGGEEVRGKENSIQIVLKKKKLIKVENEKNKDTHLEIQS